MRPVVTSVSVIKYPYESDQLCPARPALTCGLFTFCLVKLDFTECAAIRIRSVLKINTV